MTRRAAAALLLIAIALGTTACQACPCSIDGAQSRAPLPICYR